MCLQYIISDKIHKLALDDNKILEYGLKHMREHNEIVDKLQDVNNCLLTAHAIIYEIELITGNKLLQNSNESIDNIIRDFCIDIFNCYLITFLHTETVTTINGHSFVVIKYNNNTFEIFQSNQKSYSLKDYIQRKENRLFTLDRISNLIKYLNNISQNISSLNYPVFIWKSFIRVE